MLAGIGVKKGLAEKALASVEERLENQDTALSFCSPLTKPTIPTLAEVSSYPPGYKENAGYLLPQQPLDLYR